MIRRIVLDASAFDVLTSSRAQQLWAGLELAWTNGAQVCCAAVTLAEVCRGTARTRRVEVALARDRGGDRIQVVDTDVPLAKQVGHILHSARSGSERLADAHVVAACEDEDVATAAVLTSDPKDIVELAAAVPGTRILVRDPTTLGPIAT